MENQQMSIATNTVIDHQHMNESKKRDAENVKKECCNIFLRGIKQDARTKTLL